MSWSECAIVDDNKFDRFICDRILQRVHPGMNILEFQTGREMLDYLVEGKAKESSLLILLDLNMPEMNGHEFLEAYSELTEPVAKSLDVIIVTSSSLAVDKQRSMAHPAVKAYFSKPLLVSKVEEVFAEMLS